jgi:hypothetical protein
VEATVSYCIKYEYGSVRDFVLLRRRPPLSKAIQRLRKKYRAATITTQPPWRSYAVRSIRARTANTCSFH